MIILAYIDPGAGALIVQMLIAALAGSMIYFRRHITRLLGFFKRSDKNENDEKNGSEPPLR